MKRLSGFLYFLSAFIATGTILLFILLPLRFYAPVWNGYRILTVSGSDDIEQYISAAEDAGISGIASEFSVSNRFSLLGTGRHERFPFTDTDRYTRWFRDAGGEYRYLYLPYTSIWKYLSFYFSLYGKKAHFFLEAAIPYSPIQGLLALILFAYCIAGSRKRLLFFAAAFSFVCYAFCSKSNLSSATALLSILTATYWLEALENELTIQWKQLKERIKHNIFMLILPAAPLLTAVIDGIAPFCFFLLALLLSASMLFSVYSFLQLKDTYWEYYRQHPSLKLFAMHPQSWTQFWNTRYALTATVLTGCLLLVSAIIPLVFSTNRLSSAVAQLNAPQPVARQPIPFTDSGFFTVQASRPQDYLPDLSNYIEDYWYTAVLPYLNIHEPLQPLTPNMRVYFDSFSEDSEGKLHREEKVIYAFDTVFILRALRSERLALLPLEKMLIAQTGFFAAAYRSLPVPSLNPIASFFIILGTLLFPGVLIIISKIR
jgi:putative membrane protein